MERQTDMRLNIEFENYHRLDLILKLIDRVNAQSYLEIGCDKNQIFSNINCKNKVGVDPSKGGNLRMTSDDYFSTYRDMFDIIFIDGLHHYDQVTRDLNNSLERLNNHGYIIIHDLLPVFEDETSMPGPIKSLHWLGDTWRLAFDLMNRSDLTFKIIAMDCGCGIVTKKPQIRNNIVHQNSWNWYSKNYSKLPFIKFNEI